MKILITLLITLSILNASSQDFFKITIDNPRPRVGDVVKLSFEKDPFKIELESQMPSGIKVTSSKDIFGMGNQNLSKSLEFYAPGNYTIGPFIFEINDSIYITDSVNIVVAPKLPYKPGVWVRYYEFEGEKYLVVEQYVKNKSDYKKNRKGSSYTVGGVATVEYASLASNPQKGVMLSSSGSMSTTKRDGDSDAFSAGLGYSRKTYKINFTQEFNGTFKLKKEHFEDFPKRTDLDVILIEQ